MKTPKKKHHKDEPGFDDDAAGDEKDSRAIPFGALAELTSSDVIAEVKRGMSSIEPLDLFEDEFNEDAA